MTGTGARSPPNGSDTPVETASAAACGRARSPVKMQPFRRTRSAAPGVTWSVGAASVEARSQADMSLSLSCNLAPRHRAR
jgi:hypothetical protein